MLTMTFSRQLCLCWRALRYFAYYRKPIFGLVLLTCIATCVGLLQVWPLAILVDSVLAQTPRTSLPARMLQSIADQPLSQIVILAVAAVALRICTESLGMLQTLLRVHVGHDSVFRFRCDLFRKLQSLHLSFHRDRPQGDVLYRLNEDTNSLQALLAVLLDTATAFLTLSVIFVIMINSNLELTLLALSIAPVLFLINVWFANQLGSRCRAAKDLDSRLLFEIQRSMSAIPLIQVFCRERSEFGRFQQSASVRDKAWQQFHRNAAIYRLCVGLVFGAGTAMMLGYGGYLVHRDQFVTSTPDGMTVGSLMVFVTYLAMFYDPLCKLSGAGASIQASFAGIERVLEVLDQEPVICDAPGALCLSQQPRTLTLDDVSFSYAQRSVLDRIQLSIAPGEMVAFVGRSGAGKSTLLNLLPRFYDPTGGRLLLDQHDIRSIALADLRKHIAVVLQEGIILPTTVAENIAYGTPDADEAQIREAAIAVGAHAFIEGLADGYQTVLTEGGRNLSGGQRQRIAIARALLTQAPILVLDEPTSALDHESERQVTETLNRLKGRRTIIIVSHRLSTVAQCDRILVLSCGRIVEQGSHQQLVHQRGPYCEMLHAQNDNERPLLTAAA
jgi:ABC-type multidrug transport system fused ATPase/permease subunit